MSKVIAIDGPAGAGKSTVARRLAEAMGYTYLDTGSLYRAVTWYLLNANVHLTNGGFSSVPDGMIRDALNPLDIRLRCGRVWVGQEDVTDRIRDMEVSRRVSMVSERRPVREKLLSLQRAAADRNIVVDGRDIGTVVFPNAFLKVYLDADMSIRSDRRLRELSDAGVATDYGEVLENLKMRDERDSKREIAPLSRAPDAIYLDTTSLSVDEVIAVIRKLADDRARSGYAIWKKIFYRTVWTILKALTKVYLFRQISGKSFVNAIQGPAILASNHLSHLDPPLVAVSMNRPIHFLAKRELTGIPIFGHVIAWLSAVGVRRGIMDREAMAHVRSILASGGIILIFPEGTRSRDGQLHDAKAGFGKIVLECGVPVVPVRIIGSDRSFPPGAWFPRPSPVRVIFGEPLYLSGSSSQSDPSESALRDRYERIGCEVMDRIAALSAEK